MTSRIKLLATVTQTGQPIFSKYSRKTGPLAEYPEDLMFKSLNEFEQTMKNKHIDLVFVQRQKLRSTNLNDFDQDDDITKWRADYIVPFEEQDKPAHIFCSVHLSSYILNRGEKKEFNAYMDCHAPRIPKEVAKELNHVESLTRQQLVKKNGTWQLD